MKPKLIGLIIHLSIFFKNYSLTLEEAPNTTMAQNLKENLVQNSEQLTEQALSQRDVCELLFKYNTVNIKCINIDSDKVTDKINETLKSFNKLSDADVHNMNRKIILELENITFTKNRIPKRFLEIDAFLDDLYIRNCELKAIARNAFRTPSLRQLKRFALIGNSIRILNTKSIVDLGSLEELILAEMPLAEFRVVQFGSFANLRSLIIHSITNKDFTICGTSYGPLALYELYFNENHLVHSIRENFFEGFTKVQIMDLSRNSIAYIRENAFNETKFPDLLSLDLSHNKLTKLDPNFFNRIPEKTQIILNFNPWHCDCHLKSVLQYFALQKSKRIVNIAACEYPNEYEGMKLMDLEWEDLCDGYHRLECNVATKSTKMLHVREPRLRIVNADDFETKNELKLWSAGDQENTTFVLIIENMNVLDQKQCHTFSGNTTINGKYLKYDQTYRICRFENDVKTISILDCATFHRGPDITANESTTVWIYMSARYNIMIYSLICNCVAFFFGIPLAYLVAIIFPVVTRKRNKNLYTETSERIQEVKDRLREVHPIQKRISMQEKLCRAKSVRFSDEVVLDSSFGEIEGSSTPVQPPPVPKRTRITKLTN